MACFFCPTCGAERPLDTLDFTCDCGGLFSLRYEPPTFDTGLIDRAEFSQFRYRAFFPLQNELWRTVSMGEGMTPVVDLGDDLLCKLEYQSPTLSFKDRGAVMLAWMCKSLGIDQVILDSSGNAGNAMAAYSARAGLSCEVYVPKGTSPQKIKMIAAHGAKVTVHEGARDDTAKACRRKAKSEGIYYANHSMNAMFFQGTKTYVYELYEQLGRIPDNLFVPVGSGSLLLGIRLGLTELYAAGLITEFPHLFLVQGEHCAPLYGATTTPLPITPKPTLAQGIAIGNPARGSELLTGYQGQQTVVLAAETAITPAREALAQRGLFVEHTTAAVFAAYEAYRGANELNGTSLLPLTGAGLKSEYSH